MDEPRVSIVLVLSSGVRPCTVLTKLGPVQPASRVVGPWRSHELGENTASLSPSKARVASCAGASCGSVDEVCGNG